MKISRFFVILIGTYVITGAVQAEELTGTLKKIREKGSITLGVREDVIPFAYLNGKQSVQGYSVDICQKIVAAVQKHLGLPSLKVEVSTVSGSTRVPMTANGTVDLECGSTVNTPERQKSVAFSVTTFVSGTRLLTRKTSNINTLEDLKGKSVVGTTGSTNSAKIISLNTERNLGINVIGVKDTAEAFLMLETGRADAFTSLDLVLASLASDSKSSGDYTISQALSVEPIGIMLRRDDPEFKKVVDTTIIGLFKSGEIERIYSKWFQSPIPPKGNNLNWPISQYLKAAIANPTDSADPASYGGVPNTQEAAGKKK